MGLVATQSDAKDDDCSFLIQVLTAGTPMRMSSCERENSHGTSTRVLTPLRMSNLSDGTVKTYVQIASYNTNWRTLCCSPYSTPTPLCDTRRARRRQRLHPREAPVDTYIIGI